MATLNPDHRELTDEAKERLAAADRHWKKVCPWLDDVLAFTQPRNVRPESKRALTDEASLDLFTSIGIEVNGDFASDLLSAFTPEQGDWVELKPGIEIPEAERRTVKEAAKALAGTVFQEISRSEFYATAPSAYKDFGASTGSIFIQDIGAALPANVHHIPLSQLRLQVGPYGGVDDRFWVRKVFWKDIPAIFPGVQDALPPELKKKLKDNRMGTVEIVHGGWRIWDDVTQERWQWVQMIDGWMWQPQELNGAGSMPMIVGRWDPNTLSPWGTGPGFNALADLRSLDDVNYNIIDNVGKTVSPPMGYPDDGILNPRDGVEAGDWLPMRPESGKDIVPLISGARLDLGYFTKEDFELTIRRHYFQDQPIQRGKTPPTLGQWLDEAQRIQKRLGVPAAPMFAEFAAEVFLRFHRIKINRGQARDIKLKDGTVVQLVPVNPVQRAQKQEDVLLAVRLMEIITQFFGPEVARVVVNMPETVRKIKDALGDDLVELENLDQAQAMTKLQTVLGMAGQAPPEMLNGGGEGARAA
ncbi:MAG: portal protein [Alphaproteobacteria bacterium]